MFYPTDTGVHLIIDGDHIETISNTEDVPEQFCTECINYIEDTTESKEKHFNVHFDCTSGEELSFVQIGEYGFNICISTEEEPCMKVVLDLPTENNFPHNYMSLSNKELVKCLLVEAVEDFERDFSKWVNILCVDKSNKKVRDEKAIELHKLLLRARAVIQDYERTTEVYTITSTGNNYPITDRATWEKVFYTLFEPEFDSYMYYQDIDNPDAKSFLTDRGGYENDVFLINPYYWGDDEKIAGEPNFIYKPSDLKIYWYKYPFRGAYMNKDIKLEEFIRILQKCKTSM